MHQWVKTPISKCLGGVGINSQRTGPGWTGWHPPVGDQLWQNVASQRCSLLWQDLVHYKENIATPSRRWPSCLGRGGGRTVLRTLSAKTQFKYSVDSKMENFTSLGYEILAKLTWIDFFFFCLPTLGWISSHIIWYLKKMSEFKYVFINLAISYWNVLSWGIYSITLWSL